MFIFGITGGSGAGKTAVLRVLKSIGALTLDCDKIYHELLASSTELQSQLESRFTGVLRDDGIDRKRLGEIVFNNPVALLELNEITHKYVSIEIDKRISEWATQGGKITAIDAIALIESGVSKKCDVVVGITAPREIRLSRIINRDKLTREQAEMRIDAQKPDSFFEENCDYILNNNYKTPAELKAKTKEFFTGLLDNIG